MELSLKERILLAVIKITLMTLREVEAEGALLKYQRA
jgi:hypothetical protein